tara:strand:+ start:850 stop:999 length:150 start_codon:yes stop_codon:yes gene_type:complete
MNKKKINVDYNDFEYWVKFEKYIREYKPKIYEHAYNWANDKKNSINANN